MEKYYQGVLGHVFFELEKSSLNNVLEKMFGYHLLQLGGCKDVNFISNSPVSHKIYFDFDVVDSIYDSTVQGNFADLPFLENSIDVVLAPHFFEHIDDVQEALSEIYRVLIGEGHIVVVGFNPFSLLGIANKLKLTSIIEKKSKPISMGRMISLLHRFDFEVVNVKTFFFRPLIKNSAILKKMTFMEIVGQILLPKFGGIYILVAKKKIISLTPIKHYSQNKRKLVVVSSSVR